MFRAVYNLLFPLAFLALLPGFLRRMFRRGNYRDGFGQRFGWYSPAVRERLAKGAPRPWIQAVSVGEMLVALKLIAAVRERCPELPLVLSTTTTTGMQLARERAPAGVEVVYTPIDARSAVRRAYDVLRPSHVVIVDGGLWPNLLWEARLRRVPVTLASARLSPRSERRFRRFGFVTRPMFGLLDLVCVPESADVARWEELGVPPGRMQCTGNIKFDEYSAPPPTAGERSTPADCLRSLGVREGTPVILAASTHPGEERIFAEALCTVRKTAPDAFLIVAPRHVERAPEVLRQLAVLGLSVASRSNPAIIESPQTRPDVLLLDTTGELGQWPAVASLVGIGKSFAAVGGQNPAEAAGAGRPVIFGPHMENFASITGELLRAGAAVQVPDAASLTPALADLLRDSARAAIMGERGRQVLSAHRGAAGRTADLLIACGGFSPCH